MFLGALDNASDTDSIKVQHFPMCHGVMPNFMVNLTKQQSG